MKHKTHHAVRILPEDEEEKSLTKKHHLKHKKHHAKSAD